MDSLERCRIILGLSADNEPKLALIQVLLDKARSDIEIYCRDTFIDDKGNDVFPDRLRTVQEDLAIAKYRKKGAEGETSYSLGDESASFDADLPESVRRKLHPFRNLFPRNNVKAEGD